MKCTAVKRPALKCACKCWGEFWAILSGINTRKQILIAGLWVKSS